MTTWLPIREYLLSRCIEDPVTGCWNWTGSCIQKGYGHFVSRGIHYVAHRESYKAFKGPIPDGLLVRHINSCHNRKCINPDHLELGTHQDNMDDMCKLGYETHNK